MLFDLYLDPVERVTLVGNEAYKEVYQYMAAYLQRWMKETDDPMLYGKVEKPEGAVVNKVTCYSPASKDLDYY